MNSNMKVYMLFVVIFMPQISSSEVDCNSKGGRSNERRLLLIGKAGVGKSTTGNAILGKDIFLAHDLAAKSTTKTCQVEKIKRDGKDILVADTPGLGDAALGYDYFSTLVEIAQGFGFMTPGPHAILFVLWPDRINIYDEESLQAYYNVFGSELYKYTIAIFTHVPYSKEKNIPHFIDSGDQKSFLTKLMHDTNYRYVIFGDPQNRTRRELDVKILLKKIEKMIEQNKPECFLNHISNMAEDAIQRLGMGDRDKGREKLKEAFNWLISIIIRVALSSLLGYYFGFIFSSIGIIEAIFQIILTFF
ncbi:GTPase IMAP family member 4-like [Saccostrea cucullata]|uniref:GTPase IMAP family member 4-like n=1 Tax=Saccostrea cuccullata TaxID=36930 RepID=UPI002ED2C953